MGLAQVRMGFLDNGAGFREAHSRLSRDGGNLRINRRNAEIGRIGDAFRPLPGARGSEEWRRQPRQRQRIGRMLAAHGIEQQRKVLDIARHRAVHGQIAIDLGGGRMRDAADARPHPDDAAEARGIAQRAAHVGAVREPRGTGCEGDSGAARGAGGRTRQVPGIKRRAEHFVKGIGAGAEFRRVRFGVDDGAVTFEMLDHDVGTRCDRILEDRRALRVQHALDIEQVLYRNRHSRKQAAIPDRFFHQRFGMGSGAVEAQRRQGIDFAVDLGDPLLQHVEQIERCDLA